MLIFARHAKIEECQHMREKKKTRQFKPKNVEQKFLVLQQLSNLKNRTRESRRYF